MDPNRQSRHLRITDALTEAQGTAWIRHTQKQTTDSYDDNLTSSSVFLLLFYTHLEVSLIPKGYLIQIYMKNYLSILMTES